MKKKLIRIVKMTTFFTIIGVFLQALLFNIIFASTPAKGQNLNNVVLSLDLKETSLQKVLKVIEEKTEYKFVFTENEIPLQQTTNIHAKAKPLSNILEDLATQHNIKFKRINKQIVIKKVYEKKSDKKIIKEKKKISGKVINAKTGEPLPYVNVLIKGTTMGTTTDIKGIYNISIPKNADTLVFSYIGYKSVKKRIGARTEINVKLEVNLLTTEEISVTGQRYMNTQAIKTKFNSIKVVDVISADEVGSLPDDNVGDVLKRITGVSQKGDQGEVRFVSIRGLNPDYNFTTFNGSIIAVPHRDGRRVFLDVLPSSLAKEMQVVKTFTADMDAGGIGAHINFVPRSAFDFSENHFLKVFIRSGGYENRKGPQGNTPSTKGELVWGTKLGPKKDIGILVAADYYKRNSYTEHLENSGRINWFRRSDNASLSPTFTTEGRKLTRDNQLYDFGSDSVFAGSDGMNRYLYHNNRTRFGVSAKLDFRISNNSNLSLLQFYNHGLDDETRYGNRFISDKKVKFIGVAQGMVDFESRLEVAGFDFKRQVWGTQLEYDLAIGRYGNLRIKGNYSGATFKNIENFFRFTTPNRLTFEYNLTGRNAQLTPVDLDQFNNLSNYIHRGFSNFEEVRDLTENIFEGQIDYSYNFNKDGFGFKSGTKFRTRKRDYNEDQLRWIPLDESVWTAKDFISMPYVFGMDFDPTQLNNELFILDKNKVFDILKKNRSNTSLFTFDDRIQRSNERDYGITENIIALYSMITHVGSNHNLNVGLRIERTNFDGRGRTRVNGNKKEWEDISNSGNYLKLLPSLNFTYNLSNNLKGRFAYSRSLGRPNFIAFAPRGESLKISEIEGQDEVRGNRGNPNLKPRESDNIDLSIEYYIDGGSGIISAGLFHKNIKNEFFKLTETTEVEVAGRVLPALISQYSNLDESVKMNGIELNIIKDFSFLPSIFDGFGFTFNAIWMFNDIRVPNTSGTDENKDGLNDLSPYTKLDGLKEQANQVYNVSLYYESGKWKSRLAWHRTGDFLDNINTSNPERNLVQLSRDIMDFKLGYKLNNHLRFSLLIQNITDSGRRSNYDFGDYAGGLARLVKRDFGRTLFLGVTYNL